MDKPKIDPNDRIEGVWCVDSETGERILMDRITNRRIAHKNENGETVWEV